MPATQKENSEIVWQPPPRDESPMARFHLFARREAGAPARGYDALHRWACEKPNSFWPAFWRFAEVRGEMGGAAFQSGGHFCRARWFPRGRLNYAENLLAPGAADDAAIITLDERGRRRRFSRGQLRGQTGALAAALKTAGIKRGDRVAAVLPNGAAAATAMLAATSIGAVFSSCSPDFGAAALTDRFAAIQPKALFVCPAVHYGGRRFNLQKKMTALAVALPSLRAAVVAADDGRLDCAPALIRDIQKTGGARIKVLSFKECVQSPQPPRYVRVPFNHPLFILFSSGTTGRPKCIVHGNGALLEHRKELLLHGGLGAGDALLYFTTCGWMMWNWQMSILGGGGVAALFDGHPMWPAPDSLLRAAAAENTAALGVSAGYLAALQKAAPSTPRRLGWEGLRAVFSTGSPLLPPQYDFFRRRFGARPRLQSISGGTDLLGCFVLGHPGLPVRRGEIPCLSLGYDVAVFNSKGRAVHNEKGELVCRRPFISQPLGFWRDADGKKYRAAYFSKYKNTWAHGDFAETRPRTFARRRHTSALIYGRSDATLNPGGVRIGTAEIYRAVEGFKFITGAMAVAMPRALISPAKIPRANDEVIALFLKLQSGESLTAARQKTLRRAIVTSASPRHAPAVIAAAPDLPRTMNGKLAELTVARLLRGEPPQNTGALQNPESLAFFSAWRHSGARTG